jgi:hypothetical protein
MCGGGFHRPVNLNQNEVRRIVSSLENVEAGNAGLLNAAARVFDTGRGEGLNAFSFHMDMNMDNLHAPIIPDREQPFYARPAPAMRLRRAGLKSRAERVGGGQEVDCAKEGEKEMRGGANSAHIA